MDTQASLLHVPLFDFFNSDFLCSISVFEVKYRVNTMAVAAAKKMTNARRTISLPAHPLYEPADSLCPFFFFIDLLYSFCLLEN